MEEQVYVDGTFYPRSEAKVSVFDHGLLYGDGIFEGIRVYYGKVFLEKEHIDRLYDGAKAIHLQIPITKEEMAAALKKTIEVNKTTDGYIRLLVTRGVGNLGLNPYQCPKASVIIICSTIKLYSPELYEKGMFIVSVCTPACNPESKNPRIKSLNYLTNIMAKIEAHNAGCEEAVMLNTNGFVAECTGDNIFIIKNGMLKTPPSTAGILEGCTRNLVMKLAKEDGITVEEANMHRYDLYTADECFLTGTAAEIMPVTQIDARVIGTGAQGNLTIRLRELFRSFIKKYST